MTTVFPQNYLKTQKHTVEYKITDETLWKRYLAFFGDDYISAVNHFSRCCREQDKKGVREFKIAIPIKTDFSIYISDKTPNEPVNNVYFTIDAKNISKEYVLIYDENNWNPYPQVNPPYYGKYLVTLLDLNTNELCISSAIYDCKHCYPTWRSCQDIMNCPSFRIIGYREMPKPFVPTVSCPYYTVGNFKIENTHYEEI